MASLATAAPATTPSERRLQAEWKLLTSLATLNPARLSSPRAADTTFHVTLLRTPALAAGSRQPLDTHALRIVYPRFFPALPLELYLDTPVFHPNIHPETGFICLWDRHRASNTVEHALHKVAAILGWRLLNHDPQHTMQPDAAALLSGERELLRHQLHAPLLQGVQLPAGLSAAPPVTPFRRRLS